MQSIRGAKLTLNVASVCFNALRPRQNAWPSSSRWHFQMHFPEWRCINSDLDFTEVCSQWSRYNNITIFQHGFRWWLGAGQATSHYLNQGWLVYGRIYASPGLSELNKFPILSIRRILKMNIFPFLIFKEEIRYRDFYCITSGKLWRTLLFTTLGTNKMDDILQTSSNVLFGITTIVCYWNG